MSNSTAESLKELTAAKNNIGKKAELTLMLRNSDKLIVAVHILDVTRQYGKIRYTVAPILSKERKKNKTIVNADKLKFL